jgi:hypothetical protein
VYPVSLSLNQTAASVASVPRSTVLSPTVKVVLKVEVEYDHRAYTNYQLPFATKFDEEMAFAFSVVPSENRATSLHEESM